MKKIMLEVKCLMVCFSTRSQYEIKMVDWESFISPHYSKAKKVFVFLIIYQKVSSSSIFENFHLWKNYKVAGIS